MLVAALQTEPSNKGIYTMYANVRIILQTAVWLTLLAPLVTWGAVFTVQTVTDIDDALALAATNGEDDIINISSNGGDSSDGTYNLTAPLAYRSYEDYAITIQSSDGDIITLDAQNQDYRGLYIRTYAENAHVTLKGIIITNGYANDYEGGGGAYIYAARASITVKNSSFINNLGNPSSSKANGAGLRIKSEEGGSILLDSNIFKGNNINGAGGGLYLDAGIGSTVNLKNNFFDSNNAIATGGGAYISVIAGTLDLTKNNFNGNATSSNGAGLYANLFYDCTIVNISDNTFWENRAQNNMGEDMYVIADGNKNGFEAKVSIENNSYNSLNSDVGNDLLVLRNNTEKECPSWICRSLIPWHLAILLQSNNKPDNTTYNPTPISF